MRTPSIRRIWYWPLVSALILIIGHNSPASGQDLLRSQVSISVKNIPVQQVLNSIAQQAKISFSYSSDLFRQDSLVTLTMEKIPVIKALTAIFGDKYHYKQIGNFIVIRPARKEKFVILDGRVTDLDSGTAVDYASVYSRKNFSSALTDEFGNFKLRFRASVLPIEVTVSKVGYADTTLTIDADVQNPITVKLRAQAINLDTLVVKFSPESRFWLARLFVSSRLRAHSRNITQFFESAPFQIGLTPGLSTHGKLASKVESKVSVNIYGGYNGGVNGIELGGIFNISKADVRYFQAATTFNLVYGRFAGVQLGGLFNQVARQVSGVQIATLGNHVDENLFGIQLSGVGNISGGQMRGVQAAALFNYARNMNGLQVGLINLSGTSSGLSLGLVNLSLKGPGSLSVAASELAPASITWRSGNPKIYNLTSIGIANADSKQFLLVGVGLGKDLAISSKLNIENQLSVNKLIRSASPAIPLIYRFQTGPKLRIAGNLSVSAGPSVSAGHNKNDRLQPFASRGLVQTAEHRSVLAWLGWYARISWSYTIPSRN